MGLSPGDLCHSDLFGCTRRERLQSLVVLWAHLTLSTLTRLKSIGLMIRGNLGFLLPIRLPSPHDPLLLLSVTVTVTVSSGTYPMHTALPVPSTVTLQSSIIVFNLPQHPAAARDPAIGRAHPFLRLFVRSNPLRAHRRPQPATDGFAALLALCEQSLVLDHAHDRGIGV